MNSFGPVRVLLDDHNIRFWFQPQDNRAQLEKIKKTVRENRLQLGKM